MARARYSSSVMDTGPSSARPVTPRVDKSAPMVVEKEASGHVGTDARARSGSWRDPSRRSGHPHARLRTPPAEHAPRRCRTRCLGIPRPRRPRRVSLKRRRPRCFAPSPGLVRVRSARQSFCKGRGRGEREGVRDSDESRQETRKRSLQTLLIISVAAPALRRLSPSPRSFKTPPSETRGRLAVSSRFHFFPHFWPAWRAVVEVVEFPVVLRRTLRGFPLLHLRNRRRARRRTPRALLSARLSRLSRPSRRRLCRGVDGCVRSGVRRVATHYAIDRYAYPDRR